MEQWEFYREVFSHIPRATKAERGMIRRELQEHLEDSAGAYEAAGYPAGEAALRAVEAMGDPAEIGRAFNELLSPFWLWLGRGCLALAAAFCVMLLSNSENLQMAGANLTARAAPALLMGEVEKYLPEGYTLSENIDLRLDMGDEVIRVCRIYMDPSPGCRVGVGMVHYSKDLHGWASYADWPALYAPSGQTGNSGSNYCPYGVVVDTYLHVPVQPGDTYITLIWERQGQRREMNIPLPWEVTP